MTEDRNYVYRLLDRATQGKECSVVGIHPHGRSPGVLGVVGVFKVTGL